MTPEELKGIFLEQAPDVLKKVMGTFGEMHHPQESLSKKENELLKLVWPTLSSILVQSGEVNKIDAKTAQDVLKAVSQGKLSLPQAREFMALLQTKQEIEELPKLLEKLEALESGKQPRIG